MSEAVHRRLVALGCFFLSGAAGLIAEVCWIRRASLAFGSTTYALSTVLAVFFLGLTTGAFLAGERSPRVRGGAGLATRGMGRERLCPRAYSSRRGPSCFRFVVRRTGPASIFFGAALTSLRVSAAG